jgi:hypothetical protein
LTTSRSRMTTSSGAGAPAVTAASCGVMSAAPDRSTVPPPGSRATLGCGGAAPRGCGVIPAPALRRRPRCRRR